MLLMLLSICWYSTVSEVGLYYLICLVLQYSSIDTC
uniref:Uncharacterized protein n=1 Tax=Anguilla anguilla TaxID=7936 RepID=A0A0E9XH28_ANGAN